MSDTIHTQFVQYMYIELTTRRRADFLFFLIIFYLKIIFFIFLFLSFSLFPFFLT